MTVKTTVPCLMAMAVLAVLAAVRPVHAQSGPGSTLAMRPLWELGAGAAAIRLPDYRGSDQKRSYLLPVPYFVYRGVRFKADRNGVRTTLFDSDRIDLSLSANATLPVSSHNNAARSGMADLKPTVELGPILSLNVWQSAAQDMKLDLRAPLRTSLTLERSPRQIGWVFAPNLNLDIRDPAGFTGWNLGMLAGPLFSTRRYNQYFYSVGAADATGTRPAYDAPGGYSGSQFTLALSKRYAHYWVGGFLCYDRLAGARFESSPLVRQNDAVSVGFAVSWIFGESARKVDASE